MRDIDKRDLQDLLAARRWLNRAWSSEKEIAALLQLKAETRERLVSATASVADVVVSGTKNAHKFDRLVELEDRIDEIISDEIAIKEEIIDMATRLPDKRWRAVIIDRYTRFMTWERIAVELNYGFRQTMRLHKAALYAVSAELKKMS